MEDVIAYENQMDALTMIQLSAQLSLPTLEVVSAFRQTLEEGRKN